MAAKASGLTRHGRPGPVLLDFPKDIQIALVPAAAPDVQPSDDLGVETTGPLAEAAIKRAASLIANARRPVFYGGGGLINSGIDACHAFTHLVQEMGAPCTLTLLGLGAFPAASSEERRVGKEGGRTCGSRWSPCH